MLGYRDSGSKGAASICSVDQGSAELTDGVDELEHLEIECIVVFEAQFLVIDVPVTIRIVGCTLAVDCQDLVLEVGCQVSVLLENAQLAFTLEADTARGYIGDTVIFKFDAGIGNIDIVRQHRNSAGRDLFHRAID